MTKFGVERTRRPRTAAALAAAAASLAGSPANAQVVTRFSSDVSATEGVATNPFLGFDSATSGYIQFSAAPSFVISEPVATTVLSGQYRRTQYYEHYSSTDGFGLSASHSRQLGSRTNASVSINYDSSITGERQDNLAGPVIPGDTGAPTTGTPGATPGSPGAPTVIDTNDPTLIGTRSRVKSLVLSSNIDTTLSAFDSLALSSSVTRSFYNSRLGADSRTYSTTASYNRTLGQGSSVGARLSVSRSDYLSSGIPDSTILQPQLTYSRQLSGTIHVDAAIGGLFIQSSDDSPDTKSYSGNINACYTGEHDNLCLSAARDASASGAGGVRTRVEGALQYSYRLAEYDTFSVSINYSHYGAALPNQKGSTFLDTETTWETRLTQRILGGATASIRGIEDEISSRRDFSLQVFLRMTLGQLQ